VLSRREALLGIGAAVGTAALGCGRTPGAEPDAASGPPDASPDAPPDAPPDAYDACAATSDLGPDELLAGIDTFVVLCMENRSFDHYLGSLRLTEGRADVDGLTGTESNPDPDGAPVPVHWLDDYTPADPPHDWDSCHAQWDGGANDGFVRAHAGTSQADVMGYYVRDQIPITYALADQAAVCQRWFASVMGPTWPNRFYLHCGTSKGQKSNLPELGLTSIFDRCADAGVDAVNYYHDVPWAAAAYGKLTGNVAVEKFFEAAAAGTLPPFALIDPQFSGSGANDDHPSHDVRLGQALVASVVAALAQSPQGPRCLLVITYDEHGGFFDHVPPPETIYDIYDFRQIGFRVPSIVVGPTVRRGCAVDAQLEHVSIAATLTRRFGLEPLTSRANKAGDLSPCIDPRALDAPGPPPVLPPVPVSMRALAARRPADSHRELHDALAARPLPPGLDRRAEADAITRRVLAWGERLGAVRLVD